MDARLVAWARAVKARRRDGQPVLWLFTDSERLADPCHAIAALPRGLCGVVLRHPVGPALARRISRLCRARRIALVIAGDWRLAAALGAGLHLRRGRRIGARRRWKLLTSSAHGAVELRRARRAGAIAFLSPAFPTTSHPGAAALGAVRWNALARPGAAALGGIDGHSARRLRFSCAAGAIGALI